MRTLTDLFPHVSPTIDLITSWWYFAYKRGVGDSISGHSFASRIPEWARNARSCTTSKGVTASPVMARESIIPEARSTSSSGIWPSSMRWPTSSRARRGVGEPVSSVDARELGPLEPFPGKCSQDRAPEKRRVSRAAERNNQIEVGSLFVDVQPLK